MLQQNLCAIDASTYVHLATNSDRNEMREQHRQIRLMEMLHFLYEVKYTLRIMTSSVPKYVAEEAF